MEKLGENNIMSSSRNINPNLILSDYFNIIGLSPEDFKDKKIVSIGGGFGILEDHLARTQNSTVEIVDPLFENIDQLENKLKDNINRIQSQKLEIGILHSQEELIDLMDKEGSVAYYNALGDNTNVERKIDINKRKDELLGHLRSWRKGDYNGKLIGNASYGNDIRGIEDKSQDYVMINHLLYSLPGLEDEILNEAKKLLKDDGKIILIDYLSDLKDLQHKFQDKTAGRQGSSFCVILNKSDIDSV